MAYHSYLSHLGREICSYILIDEGCRLSRERKQISSILFFFYPTPKSSSTHSPGLVCDPTMNARLLSVGEHLFHIAEGAARLRKIILIILQAPIVTSEWSMIPSRLFLTSVCFSLHNRFLKKGSPCFHDPLTWQRPMRYIGSCFEGNLVSHSNRRRQVQQHGGHHRLRGGYLY